MKTTIEWFKPEEKKPRNGEVIVFCMPGYITTMNVYDGHFNCSAGDNFETEIEEVLFWSYMPKELDKIADEEWIKRHDEN